MEGSNLLPQSGKLVLMTWHYKVDTMIDLEDKLTVDPPPQHDAKELMIPCVQLSKVFPVRPGGRYLHVFVQRPYSKRN